MKGYVSRYLLTLKSETMGNAATKNMIKALLGQTDNVAIYDAEVVSVDRSARSCKVKLVSGKSANEIEVRLMAAVDDGAYMIPATGSTVVVALGETVQPLVLMYSEVEEIEWLGGEYGGVPIVKHPTNTNKGLLKKINNLESKYNDLLTACQSQVVTLAPSGAFPMASFFTSTTPIAPTTQQADIEHPKITH